MMTIGRFDMRLTDTAIVQVLADANYEVTYAQLAETLDCSVMTVRRGIARLIARNWITRYGSGRRGSFTYEVQHGQLPDAVRVAIANSIAR